MHNTGPPLTQPPSPPPRPPRPSTHEPQTQCPSAVLVRAPESRPRLSDISYTRACVYAKHRGVGGKKQNVLFPPKKRAHEGLLPPCPVHVRDRRPGKRRSVTPKKKKKKTTTAPTKQRRAKLESLRDAPDASPTSSFGGGVHGLFLSAPMCKNGTLCSLCFCTSSHLAPTTFCLHPRGLNKLDHMASRRSKKTPQPAINMETTRETNPFTGQTRPTSQKEPGFLVK